MAQARGARTAAAGSQPVTVGITSVNPQVARPGHPITVQGTVSNPTRTGMSGLTVQLSSSIFRLTSRAALSEYAAGNLSSADEPLPGALARLPGTLAPGAVRDWTVTIPAATLPLSTFGVYPLAAEVASGRRHAEHRPHIPAVLAGVQGRGRAHPADEDRLDLARLQPARAVSLPGPAQQRPGRAA